MQALPADMRFVKLTAPGGPDVLVIERMPVPVPGPGEVLIRVNAAGVNRPDIIQREGRYPHPPGASPVLGLEVSGTVAALGAEVTVLAPGEPVCALAPGGGYAEFCVVPALHCLPIPAGMDRITAAAIPETFFTVWTNLFQRGRLASGEVLLVHGGSSGIGATAIQLGHAFGARVFATAGSEEKCAFCRGLGAEAAINYRVDDFVDLIKLLSGGPGADVILDMVGGDYVARNLEALAPEGRLVQIGFQQGSRVELDLMSLMLKRQTLTGSTLRPRSVADKATIAAALRERVWPLLASGQVQVPVFSRFPLEAAAEAHRLMESSEHMGKIVLEVAT